MRLIPSTLLATLAVSAVDTFLNGGHISRATQEKRNVDALKKRVLDSIDDEIRMLEEFKNRIHAADNRNVIKITNNHRKKTFERLYNENKQEREMIKNKSASLYRH